MIEQPSPQTNTSAPSRLWVVWLLFFFQYAGIGIYFTFLNVYYREAGLTGTQIGLLNMVTASIGVAAAVVWGYLSDRTGQSRLLIAFGAGGALVVAQFVPTVDTFEAFLMLGCFASLLGSAPSTLVDSTAMALLGDRREEYGRYRLGGSFGYIITAMSAGFMLERFGLTLMFPAYGLIMAGFAGVALLLPAIAVRREARDGGTILRMVRRPKWIVFTASIFISWIAINASLMFLTVSLKAMGAGQGLIGVAVTIGAIVEIPFMFFSGRLLRRFGTVRLLMVAMALMVARFFMIGFMPAPEWAIAINMLNGPAFVFYWNSAVTHANKMAPAGLGGTAQGLLIAVISLAGVISSVLSGWLFDVLGPTEMFIVMGFFTLVALALFAVGSWIKWPEPQLEPNPTIVSP
jgi:MFS transporter, PPP family, 3-phenylpropionic acid transporter